MPYLETEGIILKKFKYSDSSIITTIFTKDFGKFNAIVKGARSLKSKHIGIFETINHIKIVFNKKENRELQIVSKAEILNSFPNLKKQIEKLLISFRIVELVNKLFYQYDKNDNSFILLKDTLKCIENFNNDPSIVLLYFQIKLSKNIGVQIVSEKQMDINNETFFNVFQYNIDRNDFKYLQNLYNQEFKGLKNFISNTILTNKLIELMDRHLLSNYYSSHILPSKRSILQMKNFKINQ